MKTNRKNKPEWVYHSFKKAFDNSKKVLEVGCYNAQLRNLVPNDYVGVDVDGQPDVKLNVDSEEGMKQLSKQNGDLVVCNATLEHLNNLHDVFDTLCNISTDKVLVSLYDETLTMLRCLLKLPLKNRKAGQGAYAKFYGLPAHKPLDRHRWIFDRAEADKFIRIRSKINGYKIIKTKNLKKEKFYLLQRV